MKNKFSKLKEEECSEINLKVSSKRNVELTIVDYTKIETYKNAPIFGARDIKNRILNFGEKYRNG